MSEQQKMRKRFLFELPDWMWKHLCVEYRVSGENVNTVSIWCIVLVYKGTSSRNHLTKYLNVFMQNYMYIYSRCIIYYSNKLSMYISSLAKHLTAVVCVCAIKITCCIAWGSFSDSLYRSLFMDIKHSI